MNSSVFTVKKKEECEPASHQSEKERKKERKIDREREKRWMLI